MHVHAHGDGHDHHSHGSSRSGAAVKALGVALVATGSLLVLQVAGGLVSKSLALLADAAHLLADLGGLALSYTAARLAQRPATPRRSYGLYRVEILATLVNGVVLLALSGFILYEAWHRLREPEPVRPLLMLGVASVAITVNLVSLTALRRSGLGGLNLRAAYLEVMADTLGAAGVFVAALVILPTGWVAVDPILSGILAVAIVPRTVSLVREALHVLLEGTPPGLDHEAIEAEIRTMDGVEGVHDLHVWCLTSGLPVLTAHVVVGEASCDDILDRIDDRLKHAFAIEHTTIQIEHSDRARREDSRF
jgi:cobalt-zinc-cadmium efflux system protein